MKYNIDWVTKKFDQGETLKYIFFWGHSDNSSAEVGKFVFSQWYPSPFTVDGLEYKTAEHWMMWSKALQFNDKTIAEKILQANKPGEVKELGRQIKNFDEIKWTQTKYGIVKTGNIHKFNQNQKLMEFLLTTSERILVEASPVDSIWGIGLSQDSDMIDNPYTWRGENLLGFALMEARDFLNDFGAFEYTKPIVVPPWKKYPEVDPLDMFWRMGYGEGYITDHGKYIDKLSARERKIYQLSFPASGDWYNYYDEGWD